MKLIAQILLLISALNSAVGLGDGTWSEERWKEEVATLRRGERVRPLYIRSLNEVSPIFFEALGDLFSVASHESLKSSHDIIARSPGEFLKYAPKLLQDQRPKVVAETLRALAENPQPLPRALASQLVALQTKTHFADPYDTFIPRSLVNSELSSQDWDRIKKSAAQNEEAARLFATRMLVQSKHFPPAMRPTLEALLNDKSEEIWKEALEGVNQLHPFSDSVWKRMAELIEHPSYQVRNAIEAAVIKEADGEQKLEVAGGELYSLAKYVRDCENDGMEIPAQMDCRKGEEIPLYKTVCSGNTKRVVTLTKNNFQKYADPNGKVYCDNPPHLPSSYETPDCVPGSRVQVIKGKHKDSFCVLMCRKQQQSAENFYQDINMICNNPQNGKTCFFNTDIRQDIDGSRLHKPGSKEDSKWRNIKSYTGSNTEMNCLQCHDNDAIIITPFLKGISALSPENTGRRINGPYSMSGKSTVELVSTWRNKRYLKDEGVKLCTQCHRLGEESTCGWLTHSLLADKPPRPADITETCLPSTYPYMPPKDHGAQNPEDLAELKKTLERLQFCCNSSKHSHPDCTWEPVENTKAGKRSDSAHPHRKLPPEDYSAHAPASNQKSERPILLNDGTDQQ